MRGELVVAILGAEWVAFNLIGVHAVARAAAKRVMAWLLAGAGDCLVERLVRVIAQPVAVSLPVATDLLGRLAQGLAHVLKTVAFIKPARHYPAKARSGAEANQQSFLVGVLVLTVSFEQIRHFPRHPFMMPRQIVASSYCHIVYTYSSVCVSTCPRVLLDLLYVPSASRAGRAGRYLGIAI